MRSCEVAIIGLGLMGSSALHSLVRRGADVLGFDPISMGEARGSSHGSCRVYRRYNSESEAYTDLTGQALGAAGRWVPRFVPELARHLRVTRQAVGWFRPAKPAPVRYGQFPVFLVERGRGLVCGVPDFEGRGVKAAQHDQGPEVGPDE